MNIVILFLLFSVGQSSEIFCPCMIVQNVPIERYFHCLHVSISLCMFIPPIKCSAMTWQEQSHTGSAVRPNEKVINLAFISVTL